MKFGIFIAYWLRDWQADLCAYARHVHKLGFDVIEIPAPLLLDMDERALDDFAATTRALGLEISCNVGPGKEHDVAARDPKVREAGIAFLSAIMERMRRVGAPSISGVMYTCWPNDFSDLDKKGLWERGLDSVKRLAEIAEKKEIGMNLEVVNRYETLTLNTAAEGRAFCDAVGSPRIKLLLDTFHMNIEEDDLCQAIRDSGPYLGHLHVGEHNRKLPGQGTSDWRAIGRALRDVSYANFVVIESFPRTGCAVGDDIKVWRDLTGGANQDKMDAEAAASLRLLREAFL